ncbi:MAG: 30S ribosomal protein S3ae [Candidatus Korarchaeum sp.]|nr:30S ribosomal protein S3ae [Candidatus Korarchaeum sp.]MDW8035413.1 30S ribosomal protein S3ae [Candidatus Korarchaeum sp.]
MSSRRARRKAGAKAWYNVYAVDVFPGQWIGETLADDPESLVGRNVEVVVRDITGDFMHEKYKLWFKVFKVDGNKAHARFTKEMLNKDYLRSIVQRRSSRVDIQSEGLTKDGSYVRIFTLIITLTRIRSSQKHAIRKDVDNYIRSLIPNYTVEELVRSFIAGNPLPVTSEMQRIASKVAPVKYVELRKMVLLKPAEIREAEEEIESRPTSSG